MTDIQPDPPSAASLRERIAADVRAALKARDVTTLSTLRTLLGALDTASANEGGGDQVSTVGRSSGVAHHELDRDEMLRVLQQESDTRGASAMVHERAGQSEEARRLRREIELIGRYLAN